MLKAIKFLLYSVIGLLSIALVSALILPHIISLDQAKESLTEQVYKDTGRTMTIGRLKWSILPTISLQLKDVRLSNPDGFPDTPFMVVHKAQSGVKLLPLLHGKIQIDNIKVNDLQLNLLRLANGKTNWATTSSKAAPQQPATKPTATKKATSSTRVPDYMINYFKIHEFAINNVQINLNNLATHQSRQLQLDHITSNNVNFDGDAYFLSADWRYSSSNLKKPLVTHFSAEIIAGPEKLFTMNSMKIVCNDVVLNGQVQAANKHGHAFRASIQMPETDLSQLISAFNVSLTHADKKALAKVAANMQVVISNDTLSISQLTLVNGTSTLTLQTSMSAFPPLKAQASMKITNLDLTLLHLIGVNNLSGQGNMQLNLSASGNTFAALLPALNGRITIDAQNGSYEGVDIINAINDVATIFTKKPVTLNKASATAFTTMHASFDIQDGVARNHDLLITSSIFTLNGKGKVALTTEQIRFDLAITLVNSYIPALTNLQHTIGGSFPFKISGTLNDPVITPNLQKMAIGTAEEKLNGMTTENIQAVGKSLNDSAKDLGHAVGKLFK